MPLREHDAVVRFTVAALEWPPPKPQGGFMAVDKSLIGTPTGRSKITIERGPVSNFAKAVQDENPIYQSPEAAKEAGFQNIPAPPTYGFAMAHRGTFKEQQPDDPA